MQIDDASFDFTASIGKRVKLTVRKTDEECSTNTGLKEDDVLEGVILVNSDAPFGTGLTGVGIFHVRIESMHGVVGEYGDECVAWDDCKWATPEMIAKYEPGEEWKIRQGYNMVDGWFPTPVTVEIEEKGK